MNTALKSDSIKQTQSKLLGKYQTTDLFRLSNDKVDLESNLMGLNYTLNKADFKPPPIDKSVIPKSANRTSMFMEGETTRISRSISSVYATDFNRFEFPFVDHQTKAIFDEHQRGGFHTRTNAKDEYHMKCNLRNK